MREAWLVAWREFTSTVRRPAYLGMTFGMPVAILGVLLVALLSTVATQPSSGQTVHIGVVDGTGRFDVEWASPDRAPMPNPGRRDPLAIMNRLRRELSARFEVRTYADAPTASAALQRGELAGFYVIPPDFIARGVLEFHRLDTGPLGPVRVSGAIAERGLTAGILKGHATKEEIERLLSQVELVHYLHDGSGVRKEEPYRALVQLSMPLLFTAMLLMSLLMSSSYLIQGVAEEKENRVMEVLLSSITPDQLLAGKLLGLSAAGLLQLCIWVLCAYLPLRGYLPMAEIPWQHVLYYFFYFLLGFFLFGSLMAGIGALGSTQRESQHLAALWSMITLLPLLFALVLLQKPNGVTARVLTYFPPTTPVTMLVRLATRQVATWEIPLSMAVVSVTIILSMKVSARLFGLGLLIYGKTPGLREVYRWLRSR